MPRPSNTAHRRQQIVEGLMSVMATTGYKGAAIPQIAKAAGLAQGLVHYHFNTKQEILIALIYYLTSLVTGRLKTTISSKPIDRLYDFIDAYLAYGEGASASAVACWINIGAEAVNQPEVRADFQKATAEQVQNLENICEDVLRSQNRSTAKKRDIALGITAAVEGSYRLIIGAPDLIPPGFAAQTVKVMAEALISAQALDIKLK